MRHAGRACWPAEEEFSISERQAVVTAPGIVQKGKCWQCFLFPLLFHLSCCSWGLDPSPLSSSHSWHLEALYVFEILGHLIASRIFPTPYFLNSLLTILRTKLLYSRCLFFTQILTISKVNFLQEVWYSLMTYRPPGLQDLHSLCGFLSFTPSNGFLLSASLFFPSISPGCSANIPAATYRESGDVIAVPWAMFALSTHI